MNNSLQLRNRFFFLIESTSADKWQRDTKYAHSLGSMCVSVHSVASDSL